jgi:hypothetical protein
MRGPTGERFVRAGGRTSGSRRERRRVHESAGDRIGAALERPVRIAQVGGFAVDDDVRGRRPEREPSQIETAAMPNEDRIAAAALSVLA